MEDIAADDLFSPEPIPSMDFDDIAGLEPERTEIRQTILESATGDVPDEFRTLSLLLYGPTGAGKRRLARATLGELGFDYNYQWMDSLDHSTGRPTEVIDELFTGTVREQPTAIVLDCFDKYVSMDVACAVNNRLETARKAGDDVVLLGIVDEQTMFANGVPAFFLNADVVLEIEQPDIDRRRKLLRDQLTAVNAGIDGIDGIDADRYDFARLARKTDQFGVDDIEAVSRRVAVTATTAAGIQPPIEEADIEQIIEQVDAERLERIQDEATLIEVDVPEVTFEDVGGHEHAKRILLEQVQQLLTLTDFAENIGVDFGSGILLHGPPGTGKTMLIRALANELDHTFIPVNTPALQFGRGGPAQRIPMLFHRAQRNAPAILFFDEFDTLGIRRGLPKADEQAVNTLLTELDGVQQLDEIVVIAATNRPTQLDPALLRPGRFDYHLEISYPDADVQAEIFAKRTADLLLAADVTPEWFAGMTDAVTGADIAAICERTVTIAMREFDGGGEVTAADLKLTREMIEVAYEEFEAGRLYQDDLEPSPAFQ